MYDITRQDSFVRVTEWLQNIEKVRMSGSQLYRSSDKDTRVWYKPILDFVPATEILLSNQIAERTITTYDIR